MTATLLKRTQPPDAGIKPSREAARLERIASASSGCALETAYAARRQQQTEAHDPRPGGEWRGDIGQTEMCDQRDQEKDERNNPNGHGWSLTGIAHCRSFQWLKPKLWRVASAA